MSGKTFVIFWTASLLYSRASCFIFILDIYSLSYKCASILYKISGLKVILLFLEENIYAKGKYFSEI